MRPRVTPQNKIKQPPKNNRPKEHNHTWEPWQCDSGADFMHSQMLSVHPGDSLFIFWGPSGNQMWQAVRTPGCVSGPGMSAVMLRQVFAVWPACQSQSQGTDVADVQGWSECCCTLQLIPLPEMTFLSGMVVCACDPSTWVGWGSKGRRTMSSKFSLHMSSRPRLAWITGDLIFYYYYHHYYY